MNLNLISNLIPPYGGKLVDLIVSHEESDQLNSYASRLPSVQLSERAVCDLELLASGGFSPLDRFVGREDYRRILDEMRLVNGHLFPIPIALPVEPQQAIHLDQDVALRNSKNELLAVMKIEIYEWEVLQLPHHYDFQSLRLMPAQTRERLEQLGMPNVVASYSPGNLYSSMVLFLGVLTLPRDAKMATEKLKQYYEKLGFVRMRSTPFMFRSMSWALPSVEQLRSE